MNKKIVLMLCFGLLFVTGCGKVPQLKNGEEVFLQVNGKNVSANDVYEELNYLISYASISLDLGLYQF